MNVCQWQLVDNGSDGDLNVTGVTFKLLTDVSRKQMTCQKEQSIRQFSSLFMKVLQVSLLGTISRDSACMILGSLKYSPLSSYCVSIIEKRATNCFIIVFFFMHHVVPATNLGTSFGFLLSGGCRWRLSKRKGG